MTGESTSRADIGVTGETADAWGTAPAACAAECRRCTSRRRRRDGRNRHARAGGHDRRSARVGDGHAEPVDQGRSLDGSPPDVTRGSASNRCSGRARGSTGYRCSGRARDRRLARQCSRSSD